MPSLSWATSMHLLVQRELTKETLWVLSFWTLRGSEGLSLLLSGPRGASLATGLGMQQCWGCAKKINHILDVVKPDHEDRWCITSRGSFPSRRSATVLNTYLSLSYVSYIHHMLAIENDLANLYYSPHRGILQKWYFFPERWVLWERQQACYKTEEAHQIQKNHKMQSSRVFKNRRGMQWQSISNRYEVLGTLADPLWNTLKCATLTA